MTRTGHARIPFGDELVGVPLVLHEPEADVDANGLRTNRLHEDVAAVFTAGIAEPVDGAGAGNGAEEECQ